MKRERLSPGPPIAAGVVLLLVVLAGRYGYHRDELYFLEAGEHLAWGYPDQGPLTPAIARAMSELAPGSLTVLRIPSALMTGGIVLLTALMARELGAGRRGELLAAACTAVGVIFLTTGHLLSTTTFDLLAWTALAYLAIRAVRRGDERLWPLAGVVLGLALLDKPLVAFLVAALLVGVAIAGPRRLIRSPWVWAGAGIALLLWSPWLIWQAGHGWPQLEVSDSIAEGGSTSSEPRWAFLPFQLLLVSPFLAPIWIAGLVRLLRAPELRDIRFLGWTWIALAIVFLATGGKPYYLAGLFPPLIAAGAIGVDRWLERGRRGARRAALAVAFATSAIVGGTIALPVLPVDGLDPVLAVNEDVGETVGWPRFAEQVEAVRSDLPGRGEAAVVFTENYGQAGAIDRYGTARVFSGHNGYHGWGPPPDGSAPVIVVGFGDENAPVAQFFAGCVVRARIRTEDGLDNEENGTPVRVCSGPHGPWGEMWPMLERFG